MNKVIYALPFIFASFSVHAQTSDIRLHGQIFETCKVESAPVIQSGGTAFSATLGIAQSLLKFNSEADFLDSSQAVLRYSATANTICNYELTSTNDGMKSGTSFRNYEATLITSDQEQVLQTDSGSQAGRKVNLPLDPETEARAENYVEVQLHFTEETDTLPAGIYEDILRLRVYTY